MAEYIDSGRFKESAEDRYCKPCKEEGKDYNGCRCRACWVDDMIDEVDCFQPADVAPVVRCKECKWAGGDFVCYRGVMVQHKPEDFCSYGERRGGGEDG